MMVLADLVFARSGWLPWAGVFGAVLLCLSLISYRKSAMPLRVKALAFSLRGLGIGLLLFSWLEPMASTEQPKPQANTLVVAVDNSGSMKALFPEGADESLRALLKNDASWLNQASETFQLRKYLFDGSVESVDDLNTWSGDGKMSSLNNTLSSLRSRYKGQPLAGIILITDGQGTEPNPSTDFGDAGTDGGMIPIFPVSIPVERVSRDLRIENVSVRQSEFETAPVTVTTAVSHVGYPGSRAVLDLVDNSGKTIDSKTFELKKDQEVLKAEFRFRPEQSGISAYTLNLRLANESQSSETSEITLLNNRRYQVVDRGTGPYRILYLAGRPNWEFKFLRRAIDEDAELALTSLIRIANREMKFSFRNSKLESTNPLFSGFEDVSEEEKQQYDEPVYARLGVRSAGELQKGFPKDAEELFEYSALILDDLEHDFLTIDQQQLIRQFVTVRGGALLALGGQESMRGTKFRESVLGQLLPIYGDSNSIEWRIPELMEEPQETIRFQLTREGWLQPSMRLSDTEGTERMRLDAMPEFQVFNETSRVKPGATVLIEGELPTGDRKPLFVSQRFGRGTSSAFLLGDFWRWGLRFEGDQRSPLYQAWRQILRGTMADVPRPITMDAVIDSNNPRLVKITVHVLGADYQSVDNAQVQITLRKPDGSTLETSAEPSMQVAGDYETEFVMQDTGAYIASAAVNSSDGTSLGVATSGWSFEPEAKEFAHLGINRNRLDALAQSTGGRVLSPSQLQSLANWIPPDRIPVTEIRTYPVWHAPWVIGLAFLALVLEWWLRRRYGLA